MSNKIVLMNQAVEQIQTKVTEALNSRQTFTRNDQHGDQFLQQGVYWLYLH